jgi:hypothetical protein
MDTGSAVDRQLAAGAQQDGIAIITPATFAMWITMDHRYNHRSHRNHRT